MSNETLVKRAVGAKSSAADAGDVGASRANDDFAGAPQGEGGDSLNGLGGLPPFTAEVENATLADIVPPYGEIILTNLADATELMVAHVPQPGLHAGDNAIDVLLVAFAEEVGNVEPAAGASGGGESSGFHLTKPFDPGGIGEGLKAQDVLSLTDMAISFHDLALRLSLSGDGLGGQSGSAHTNGEVAGPDGNQPNGNSAGGANGASATDDTAAAGGPGAASPLGGISSSIGTSEVASESTGSNSGSLNPSGETPRQDVGSQTSGGSIEESGDQPANENAIGGSGNDGLGGAKSDSPGDQTPGRDDGGISDTSNAGDANSDGGNSGNSQSGLGDGSNPGQGADHTSSGNQGGDNPGGTQQAGNGNGGGNSGNSHSGLGDGSNPGQGADHSNSGNQGTDNPGGLHQSADTGAGASHSAPHVSLDTLLGHGPHDVSHG